MQLFPSEIFHATWVLCVSQKLFGSHLCVWKTRDLSDASKSKLETLALNWFIASCRDTEPRQPNTFSLNFKLGIYLISRNTELEKEGGRMESKRREEREREGRGSCFFQQPALAQSELRAENSTPLSHMGCRNPDRCLQSHPRLPGSALTGSWGQEPGLGLSPGTELCDAFAQGHLKTTSSFSPGLSLVISFLLKSDNSSVSLKHNICLKFCVQRYFRKFL